jgi:hypothetical protein
MAHITDTQVESASLLAGEQGCSLLTLEVRAIYRETTAHAPCGHCIVQKQFDLTGHAITLASPPGQLNSKTRPRGLLGLGKEASEDANEDRASSQACEHTSPLCLRVCNLSNGSLVVEAWSSSQESEPVATKASVVAAAKPLGV